MTPPPSTYNPYDELRIRSGPIYTATAAEESLAGSSNTTTTSTLTSNSCPDEDFDDVDRTAILSRDMSSLTLDEGNAPNVPSMATRDTPTTPLSSSSSPPKPPPIPIHAETTALLVVDVQPEYWSNCPAVRKDFPHFPSSLASTVATCRQRNAKIIWIRANYQYSHSPWLRQFERLHGNNIPAIVDCDPTSHSFTAWEDFATPQGGDVIIPKTSWSSTTNTALMDVLKNSNIDTVLVCGLITSVCVQHSAFGIFEAGYRTMLVTDACADRGRARHDAALALYGDYMYELVTSTKLQNVESGLIPAKPVWYLVGSGGSNSCNNTTTTAATSQSKETSTGVCMESNAGSAVVRAKSYPDRLHEANGVANAHYHSQQQKQRRSSEDEDASTAVSTNTFQSIDTPVASLPQPLPMTNKNVSENTTSTRTSSSSEGLPMTVHMSKQPEAIVFV